MIILILLLFNQTDIIDNITGMQKEIQILNLINGLELSENQMNFILEKAKKTEKIKDNFYKEISNEKTTHQILNQLKENRMENEEIPNELRKRVHYAEEKMRDYRLIMHESIENLANEVENMLDPNQIYQLEHYIPCLIPPPGEINIGQSEKPSGIIQQLKRIRQIPDWLYETKKYDIVDKTVEKMKKHLPRGTEFNENAERQRILGLFDEIRAISDIDFALKNEEYANELKGKYFIKKIPLNLSLRIERFLLDPLIIPILEEKIKNTR
jgi:hypothetical protein